MIHFLILFRSSSLHCFCFKDTVIPCSFRGSQSISSQQSADFWKDFWEDLFDKYISKDKFAVSCLYESGFFPQAYTTVEYLLSLSPVDFQVREFTLALPELMLKKNLLPDENPRFVVWDKLCWKVDRLKAVSIENCNAGVPYSFTPLDIATTFFTPWQMVNISAQTVTVRHSHSDGDLARYVESSKLQPTGEKR